MPGIVYSEREGGSPGTRKYNGPGISSCPTRNRRSPAQPNEKPTSKLGYLRLEGTENSNVLAVSETIYYFVGDIDSLTDCQGRLREKS